MDEPLSVVHHFGSVTFATGHLLYARPRLLPQILDHHQPSPLSLIGLLFPQSSFVIGGGLLLELDPFQSSWLLRPVVSSLFGHFTSLCLLFYIYIIANKLKEVKKQNNNASTIDCDESNTYCVVLHDWNKVSTEGTHPALVQVHPLPSLKQKVRDY